MNRTPPPPQHGPRPSRTEAHQPKHTACTLPLNRSAQRPLVISTEAHSAHLSSRPKRTAPPCHLDRSAAQWRDPCILAVAFVVVVVVAFAVALAFLSVIPEGNLLLPGAPSSTRVFCAAGWGIARSSARPHSFAVRTIGHPEPRTNSVILSAAEEPRHPPTTHTLNPFSPRSNPAGAPSSRRLHRR